MGTFCGRKEILPTVTLTVGDDSTDIFNSHHVLCQHIVLCEGLSLLGSKQSCVYTEPLLQPRSLGQLHMPHAIPAPCQAQVLRFVS